MPAYGQNLYAWTVKDFPWSKKPIHGKINYHI
jgi:hypothetical protein